MINMMHWCLAEAYYWISRWLIGKLGGRLLISVIAIQMTMTEPLKDFPSGSWWICSFPSWQSWPPVNLQMTSGQPFVSIIAKIWFSDFYHKWIQRKSMETKCERKESEKKLLFMTFHQQSKQGPHECQTFSVYDLCGIFQRLFTRSERNFIDNYLASLNSNNRAGEISTIDRKRKIIAVKRSLGWVVGMVGQTKNKNLPTIFV